MPQGKDAFDQQLDDLISDYEAREAFESAHREAEIDGADQMIKEWQAGQQAENNPSGPLTPYRESHLDEEDSIGGFLMRAMNTTARVTGDTIAQSALAGPHDTIRNVAALIPGSEWLMDKVDEYTGLQPLGKVQEAKTMPGAIGRELTKFFSGYIPAFRVLRKLKKAPNSWAGKRLEEMLLGAGVEFAVRAPDEEKFADLLYRLGVPKNAVLDYLKADENDTWYEGRLKNFIDGLVGGTIGETLVGLGQLSKGVSRAVKKHAKNWSGKPARDDPAPQLTAMQRRVQEQRLEGEALVKSLARMGTPTNKLFERVKKGDITPQQLRKNMRREKATAKVKGAAAAKSLKNAGVDEEMELLLNKPMVLGDEQVYVNWSTFERAEDIQTVVKNMTEMMEPLIRSKQMSMTHAQQVEAAGKMGLDYKDLLNRPAGGVWTEKEVIVYTTLWKNAAENLENMIRHANKPGATKQDRVMLHKMVANFGAINAEIRGASAASSRSLNAWRINAPGLAAQARRVDEMLDGLGTDGSETMARQLLALLEDGGIQNAAANRAIRTIAHGGKIDAIREAMVGGFLWMPSTHIVNGMSSVATFGNEILKRKIASIMDPDAIPSEEASIMMRAAIQARKEGLQVAQKAWKTGQTGHWQGKGKVDITERAQWTAASWNAKEGSALGDFANMTGTIFRTPLRFLGMTDEFNKTLAYRAEIAAQAQRAMKAKGLTDETEIANFLAKFTADPPADIKLGAEQFARHVTFTDKPGKLANQMNYWRNNIKSPWGVRLATTLVFPFVNTPARIVAYAFNNSPFAVLSTQFRKRLMDDNPATRAMARAQLSTASTFAGIAADWADSGILTGAGPSDPAVRKKWLEDYQPYSIKIGGQWHSLQRADPFGLVMGTIASFAEMGREFEMGSKTMDQFGEVIAGMTLVVAEAIINKNYMQGLSAAVEAISDPKRYGKAWVGKVSAAALPLTSFLGQAARLIDDGALRENNRIRDYWKARIPGMRKQMVPMRNYWGERLYRRSGEGIFHKVYDALTPFSTQKATKNPINDEMIKLATAIDRGSASIPGPITMESSFQNLSIKWEEWPNHYDRWKQHVSEAKIGGKTLKAFLNEMVQGEGPAGAAYKQMPSTAMKIKMISGFINTARDIGEANFMQELIGKNDPFIQHLMDVQENNVRVETGLGGDPRGVTAPGLE